MNHVSKVKKLFECQEEKLQIRNNNKQNYIFSRSKTLIDFNQLKKDDEDNLLISENHSQNFKNSKRQFERQTSDSSYRSVRRSPAFRRVNGPSILTDAKLVRPVPLQNELEYIATSETIKKALKSPLPAGPAPRKPPRVFTSPSTTFTSSSEKKNLPILPPKEVNSNLKDIQSNFHKNLQINAKKELKDDEEKVYMEPFAHLKKDFTINDNKFSNKLAPSSSSKTEELHYMCTDIFDEHENLVKSIQQQDSSGSSRRSSLNSGNHNLSEIDKINTLMDVMFDEDKRELLEMEENPGSSKDKPTNMIKHRVSRSMTEKRKDYVCRVTQNPTNLVSLAKLPSTASIISQFQQIIDSNKDKSALKVDEPSLFKMVVLIGFDSSTKEGYIKSIFPKKEKPLPLLEQFVYPTSHDELMTSENQKFSIIFTDEYGNHLFGYCRSVIPEGFSKSLPFTYCIISNTLSTGLYFNLLKEIETRHGMPETNYFNMLSVLQRQKIPGNGKALNAKFGRKMPEIAEKSSSDKPQNLNRKRLSLESPEWLKAEASKSPTMLNYKTTDEIIVQRSSDTRMENADLGILFELTTSEQLVKIFGSLLIERKVILLGKNLSQVSSCVMALYSLLYPFQWHHTIISTVPKQLVEIIQAPFPFFVGLLKNSIDRRTLLDIEDGIVIDLDEKCFLKTSGDEATLLPECLKKSLLMSLKVVEIFEQGNKLRNVLIGEAFLQFFVKIFAELKASTFDKRKFIDNHQDRSTKYFLEWFVETVMFKDFIERKKESEGSSGRSTYFDLFDAKIIAKSAGQRESAETFMKNSKRRNKKNLKDRIRDFLSS